MNPGACLMRDGVLLAFAEEERFTRVKGSHGYFPGRSATWCLKRAGLSLEEVDRIAFAWDAKKYPLRMFATLGRQYLRHRGRAHASGRGHTTTLLDTIDDVLRHRPGRLREQIRAGLRAEGHRGEPPIEFVSHHLCHSYSAYFCSSFEQAVVLTLDGSGEDVCTQVAVGRGERLEVVESVPVPHSLGWFYAAFTAYFGFTPYRDEGKFMGLAALGHARASDNPWPERLARIVPVHDDGYEVDPIYTRFGAHTYAQRFTDALAEFVTSYDPRLAPLSRATHANGGAPYLDPAWIDLAFGVQARLEHAARTLADRALREHGMENLCVAGGVGLNCKMNGALLAGTAAKRVFVQPAAYDAGAAIGAAMVVAEAGGDPIRNALDHAYLGPSWSNGEIHDVLKRCNVTSEECGDIAGRVASELDRGRVVAWFQGPMELGPRALGARSILANPKTPGVRDRLNRDVKFREPWRPFCPSILARAAPDYIAGAEHAPFMTTAFAVRPERREEMSQAVHVDGSARPQTVTPVLGGRYHALLEAFEDRTGLPFVINTSFNVNGEPIVCSPAEALRSFYASGVDALALGDFFLTKT
jgi:carbamoyltransferase